MDSINKKSKEEKLRELEFWFEGNRKKEKGFREDPVYRAILEAIDRRNYESFLPFDIIKDITNYNPKILEGLTDTVIGKSIGSRLKQLLFRNILKKLDQPQIMRQATFAVDDEVKEKLKEYIKQLLNEK